MRKAFEANHSRNGVSQGDELFVCSRRFFSGGGTASGTMQLPALNLPTLGMVSLVVLYVKSA